MLKIVRPRDFLPPSIPTRYDVGQSTVEFIFSFIFVVGIIFFTLKVSLIYTNGYLVQYATYMASRAYLVFDNHAPVGGSNDGPAARKSTEVFNSFKINEFLGERAAQLQFRNPDQNFPLFSGVFYKFSLPFGLGKFFGGNLELDLTSESFLGRGPLRQECRTRVCDAISASSEINCGSREVTIFDNGC